MEDILDSQFQEAQQGSSISLLVFPNKEELRLAEDVLKKGNMGVRMFQTPEEFTGINLAVLQFPSSSLGDVYEALRDQGIIVSRAYPYQPAKARRLKKKLEMLGESSRASVPYLQSITITKVLPCLVDPDMIRVTAETSVDVSDIMPYLNRLMPGASYNHEAKTLTFTEKPGVITIYPTSIEMGRIQGVGDAISILSWIRDMVNATYENRERIQPSTEIRVLQPLQLYRYLPQTNCKQCGELTCLAFAVQVLREEQRIGNCKPLLLPEFREKAVGLFRILDGMGYEVPNSEYSNEPDS
jgi:ArsR family metal-binding transcriptional regulator